MRSTKSGNGNVLGKIGIKHFSKKAMGLLFPSRGNHGSFFMSIQRESKNVVFGSEDDRGCGGREGCSRMVFKSFESQMLPRLRYFRRYPETIHPRGNFHLGRRRRQRLWRHTCWPLLGLLRCSSCT